MKVKVLVKKVQGITVPKKANSDDAAYDVIAVSEPVIVGTKFEMPLEGIKAWSKIDYIEYKTNLFLAPQDDVQMVAAEFIEGCDIYRPDKEYRVKFHIHGYPRSSISKKNLVLANSVATLDAGYRGEVLFRFKYIVQPEDLIMLPEHGRNRFYAIINPENVYQKGDKIVQLEAEANIDIDFELAETLDKTIRGEGGFGSTG